MTMFALDSSGILGVVGSFTGSEPFAVNIDPYSKMGADVELQVSFFSTVKNPSTASNIQMRLKWVDTLTDDVIFDYRGTLNQDEEDYSSLLNILNASEEFETVEITLGTDWLAAILLSSGYNSSSSLGRNKATITLVDDLPDAFDVDTTVNILTTLPYRPAYLVLPRLDQLEVFTAALKATEKLNIPLDAEIDPTYTVDQAIALATSLDAQSPLVQFIWSPNVCRPRDATSLRGKKSACYALGQYMGMKLIRNSKLSADGIPKIADPVAGEPFPFTYKGMTARTDVVFDDETREKLAVAKINVVRQKYYDSGTKFVLSDVLTQYQSPDSALRLVNAAEIASYTTNRCLQILDRHLLKRTDTFISDVSKDIDKFLSACSNSTVALLTKSEDLGNVPYVFEVVPDAQRPFERVRFYLARRPNGATRQVIFDDYLTK